MTAARALVPRGGHQVIRFPGLLGGRTPLSLGAFLLGILPLTVWAQRETSRWEDMFSPQPPTFQAWYSVTPYFEEQVRGQDVTNLLLKSRA